MDFSGIGAMLISFGFLVYIPIKIAVGTWLVIFALCKIRGTTLGKMRGTALFLILYVLSLIASCFYVYLVYLRDMYVM
jgi:hypothetical protein